MQVSTALGGVRWGLLPASPSRRQLRIRRTPAAFRSPFTEKPSSSQEAKTGPGVILLQQLSRLAAVVKYVEKPQKIQFTSLQLAVGVLSSAVLLSMGTLNRFAGYLLIGLCLSISLSGYVRCLYLSRGAGSVLDVCFKAQSWAKEFYSSCMFVGAERFFLSPFYEPSVIYMMLNCWGLYAVGQATLCTKIGGNMVVLICAMAFFLGRLMQLAVTQMSPVRQGPRLDAVSPREKLMELLLLPNGTWGFGPLLNAMIWFCCFAFPNQLYLATPTGVLAPVWTAVGIPLLLLMEDLYSTLHSTRRSHKIEVGSTPGLQIAALTVGFLLSRVPS